MPDISKLVKSSDINAKRTATEMFGMAVEEFGTSPLNDYLRTATGQSADAPVNRNDGSWYATSYAASLANSHFRPKLKFLFRVEFLFQDGVLEKFGRGNWQRDFTFLIKSVDRPKVDFEYEEINQYNFRTKVLKQIKHRELTMTFVDDVGNSVYEFFRFMMMVHSPITRRSITATQNIADTRVTYGAGSGMEFSEPFTDQNDFAHRGVIDNTEVGNAIQAIKVTQFFLDPSQKLENSTKQVSFFFINPRVVSFDLDDVNHEVSDPNLFTMQFDYDFMVMSNMDPLENLPPEKQLPPVGSAPGDSGPVGTRPSDAGSNNPYTAILGGVAGRAAQKVSNETIGKAIRKVPGLSSVASTVGSIASGVTKDLLNRGVNQAVARPSRDVVSDATTAGRDKATYTTTSGTFGPNQPGVNAGD